jgi:NAD+ kinase
MMSSLESTPIANTTVSSPSFQPIHPHFKKALVVVKQSTDPGGEFVRRTERFLAMAGLEVHIAEASFTDGCQALWAERKQWSPDLIIVVGGDGTFLRTAQVYAPTETPMVGINRGNLGFLTRIETEAIEKYLAQLLAGHFQRETRMLLEVQSPGSETGDVLESSHIALNDVVIKTANPSQMARMQLYIDDFPVASYDADGLIISTPTGSTAYNLAAGGPVLVPGVEAVAITPICPHSLTAKPIVIPSSSKIRVEAVQRNIHPILFSLDGQDPLPLAVGESIVVQRAEQSLQLLGFDQPEDNFYWLLRQKLQWGSNPRSGELRV